MTTELLNEPTTPLEQGGSANEQAPVLPPAAAPRLYWRAVVRTGGLFGAAREHDRTEWHLAGCPAPNEPGQHCSEGLRRILERGQPDGHCVVDGVCGLCGEVMDLDASEASAAPPAQP